VPSQTMPGGVSGEIPKTLPPEQRPETKAAQTTAVEGAKGDVEKEKGRNKATVALKGFEAQAKLVTDTIDKALGTVSGWSTGVGNMVLGRLPNTDARKLDNFLATIKANLGFDKLQQMREASPTGGALGAISDKETALLQAVNGALDPLQRDQLVENLTIIKELYGQVMEERRAAYERDYGSGAKAPVAAPAQSAAPAQPVPQAQPAAAPPANNDWQEIDGVRIRRK